MNTGTKKRILILSFAKGVNGTTVHQRTFQKLFALIPEHEFVILNAPEQMDLPFDLYLNLVPPYNIYNLNNPDGLDFYEQATGWLRERKWRLSRQFYHLIPKRVRKKLVPVKMKFLNRYLRVLPKASQWITLCHDLTPVINRDWFDYPPDDRMEFLTNYMKARHVIAVSEHTRQDLIRYGIGPEKISVVYNSYDESFNLKNRGRRPSCSDYVLVVGSFEPRKNAQNVYEAFSRIKDRYPGKLVFVGSDKWGDRSVYQRIKRDPRARIITDVSKTELIGWYHGARALVYASLYEGFGLPILEAVGCGIPVVASASSGMLEAGEGYAEFVDPSKPESIAEGILKVLRPGYRVNPGARGQLLSKYGILANAERLREILNAVLDQDASPKSASRRETMVPA